MNRTKINDNRINLAGYDDDDDDEISDKKEGNRARTKKVDDRF